MRRIGTCLWFEHRALEAASYYVSLIPDSAVVDTSYYALRMSLTAYCNAQKGVDALWHRLSEGGRTGQCGWLTDRFGTQRLSARVARVSPSRVSGYMRPPISCWMIATDWR